MYVFSKQYTYSIHPPLVLPVDCRFAFYSKIDVSKNEKCQEVYYKMRKQPFIF